MFDEEFFRNDKKGFVSKIRHVLYHDQGIWFLKTLLVLN